MHKDVLLPGWYSFAPSPESDVRIFDEVGPQFANKLVKEEEWAYVDGASTISIAQAHTQRTLEYKSRSGVVVVAASVYSKRQAVSVATNTITGSFSASLRHPSCVRPQNTAIQLAESPLSPPPFYMYCCTPPTTTKASTKTPPFVKSSLLLSPPPRRVPFPSSLPFPPPAPAARTPPPPYSQIYP